MIEIQTSVRIVTPVEPRASVAGADPDTRTVAGSNALVPPVEAMAAMEPVGLLALPVPGRAPDRAPENAPGPHDRVHEALAHHDALPDPADQAERAEESFSNNAPRMDPVSLFQGLVAQASRAGDSGSDNAFQIYALVQQLATLVQPRVRLAA
ncbi:hypothetical protein DL237_10290 [Pseudooceanicola sediminis]|uniref:Uncharacterized protein n=1 Tax=Pseudooceanicola sediminis TaxID=2211117 RepID=A0A399J7B3_9RHOB|nr:hypothetical protein [Pseudooceanicola sediminis]KAA2313827.1 hypothetical protein E0K93_11980 [Puniceibacterium sp. HSS470]RII38646.1 hypothetical protein DL237_10290 [Pseudooceanicola sediminis]